MTKILLAGDSTVADYALNQSPMTGWGQVLSGLLKENAVLVNNFACPGATTKTFMEDGRWKNLLDNMLPNDIVIIQFGHNDQKKINRVSTEEYSDRLITMIEDVRDREGLAILCTPPERRISIDYSEIEYNFKKIVLIMRRISSEKEIPLFDINRFSYLMMKEVGVENSKKYFVWGEEGELENYPLGSKDDTHFNYIGAKKLAEYVKLRLRDYIRLDPIFNKIYYGACMYPEVWSKNIFNQDVKQMSEIGMNFARFGEFAWQQIEPEPGKFDLSLYEEALTTFKENEIDVCLCIPTPTPPRWLTVKYPESRIKNIDGTVMEHGSRQHCCTNNEDYRFYAYRMTREVAKLANKYENVIAIQLDNEFKCHVDLCFCDTCKDRWHNYLKDEYGMIEHLNNSWGTSIWSETYDEFSDVVMPIKTPFIHNSSLQNAFRKFTSETLIEFANDLCHIIRMESDVPITHNSAFGFNLMNNQLFKDLDVVGFDTYPQYTNYPWYTMNLDRWRNVKNTTNEMLLLETCTSHNGHIENYVPPAPDGWLTAEIFTGFAANLKSFCFWHYRSHRFGVEQPHSAVVTAWGDPDAGFEDVKNGGLLIEKMRPLIENSEYVSSDIGFLYSDNSKRTYLIDTGGIYDYRTMVTEYYGSLVRNGINIEMIEETSDFNCFKLLIIPYVRYISTSLLGKIKSFVENGGKVILGPMTGDRTLELAWPEKNGLDCLGEWLGFSLIKQYLINPDENEVTYKDYKTEFDGLVTTFECDNSWDIIAKNMKNESMFAKKQIGQGLIIYTGGQPKKLDGNQFWNQFIKDEIMSFEKDKEFIILNGGIMKYRRETEKDIQIYLCNLGLEDAVFYLHKDAVDLLSNENYNQGENLLKRYKYLILSFPK